MSVLQGAHRFEALVVGTSNRTAVTAGRAVANAPGSAYNPLLIYARPGMGKTHLLGAIAHQVFAGYRRMPLRRCGCRYHTTRRLARAPPFAAPCYLPP